MSVSDLAAGAYKLYVDAVDYRGLSIIRETRFYIGEEGDINDFIALVKPRFGVSDTFVFTAAVETALKYDQCKYAFDLPSMPSITASSFVSFADMSGFDGYNFETSQVNKLSIPLGDTSEHPLYVFCKKGDDIVSAGYWGTLRRVVHAHRSRRGGLLWRFADRADKAKTFEARICESSCRNDSDFGHGCFADYRCCDFR